MARYRCQTCGSFVKDKFLFGLLHLCLTDEEIAATRMASARRRVAHLSDCALHNGPAYTPGRCDCGSDPSMTPRLYGSEYPK